MREMDELFDFLNKLLEKEEYIKLQEEINSEQPANVAEYFDELTAEKQLYLFRLLTKDMAAEVFSYMDSDTQEYIVHSITDKEVRNIVDVMFFDDTIDFLEEAPANLVDKVLRNTDEATRTLINGFLNYPEHSAGSLMTIEFVKLHQKMTVAMAMIQIKKTGIDRETIYTCYVVDKGRKLVGVVPLRTLICADDNEIVKDLMQENVICVHTTDDQEDVAQIFKKYDWMAVPVIDKEERLVGIITVDDIVDVIDQETTEDMEKMAAILPSDEEYLKTSVVKLAKNRIGWLCILMVSGTLSSFVISQYSNLLNSVVLLSTFIPIITGTGGNAGSQTSTMMIRGMALGEIQTKDAFKILWKEIRVGIICGIILGSVNMIRLTFFSRSTDFWIDLSVSISMGTVVVLAKTIGCILPILAKALKLDPAMMAGPLISTIVDAVALMIYFSIAAIMVL